jgi:peptide/nickel transport system ATP-binding protein
MSTSNFKGLQVKDLKVYYDTPEGVVKAVDGISFSLVQGKRLALVGESGSGKSTLSMALMRLTRPPGRIAGGNVFLDDVDILDLDAEEMRLSRLSKISLVPQGAMNSLNPVLKVRDQILDGLADHQVFGSKKFSKNDQNTKVLELLNAVELLPSVANMYPHELSGGMKQRVAIAIATSMDPQVIVADEPTSALDVVVQRTVMQTLGRLQEGLEASIVLVGHDMGLVAQFANFVGVMYAGKMVELGPVNSVFEKPLHPYTRLLIRSLPTLENKEDFIGIPGLPPPLLNLPPGCTFCTRFDRENKNDPPWKEVSKDHWISECNVCSDIGK